MIPDLNFHRRVLVVLFRKYLDADRAWRLAQTEALSWFPLDTRSAGSLMGNPGSHLRRLYERHDRALSQFMVVLERLIRHDVARYGRSTYWLCRSANGNLENSIT